MKAPAFRPACTLGLLLALVSFAAAAPASAQEEQSTQAEQPDEAAPIDGLTVGGGLSFYQGDLDNNPQNNYLKYLGSSRPSLFVRADRRYGRYTLGLELDYNRLGGKRQFGDRPAFSFSNNAFDLDATGSIDVGFPERDLIRVFIGAGPTLLVSPQYGGLREAEIAETEVFRDLGTRVQGNAMIGFSVQDVLRIGAKVFPTDFIDGFQGTGSKIDILIFATIGYRFDFTD